ncbi:MAG: diguanylate cyclase [Humidesulfovibrio sp.]|nr:diguanylate cyclase [Humidesulfovibrio sp.]
MSTAGNDRTGTEQGAQHEMERVLQRLQDALQQAAPPEAPPVDLAQVPGLAPLYALVLDMRRFLLGLSQGDLQQKLDHKGYLPGVLKTFQSNLSHLTWQTQRIAEGDFSQQVDFLGEFSQAFNSMVLRLHDSIEALRESEERYRFLAENSADIIWRIDAEHRFLYASPADERTRGFHHKEILGLPVWSAMHPDFVALMQERCQSNLAAIADVADPAPLRVEVPLLRKGGGSIWVEILSNPVRGKGGSICGFHLVARDIRLRKQMEEELQRLASTDSLTGISNRRNFLDRAQVELMRSERYGLRLALLMLDIDKFKNVNDTFGHAMGDAVLKAVVAACNQDLRQVDIFGRLGGEEFAALLPQTDQAGAQATAERMRQAVAAIKIPVEEGSISVTISLGLAELRRGEDLDALMRRADAALYRAKDQGRNRICACEALEVANT